MSLLAVSHVTKAFPGVTAVDDLSFTLSRGETLALVGENGAGKSTLIQMLSGVQVPDAGVILLDNNPVAFRSARDAIKAGIAAVFQELSLTDNLSVAENLFANRQPAGRFGFIHRSTLHRRAAELTDTFGVELDTRAWVRDLSIGNRQIVEILKALSTEPRVMILDEPTSSLTESDAERLFQLMDRLRATGVSFLYVTHKMNEIERVADRVLILRDGRLVDTLAVADADQATVVRKMVGRPIASLYGDTAAATVVGGPIFTARGLCGHGFRDISLTVGRGEVVGIAGLIGAGRTEVARSIVGADPLTAGTITVEGRPLQVQQPADAMDAGLCYLTEDRKGLGLFLDMSISTNLMANKLRRYSVRFGIVSDTSAIREARRVVDAFGIVTRSAEARVGQLSGGNQQKVLVAEWLDLRPKLMIFDEPTRGVDIGARADIYAKINEFRATGAGTIIISSELPELLGLCDRILVMRDGRVVGEVPKPAFSEERIMAYATGLAEDDKKANYQSEMKA